MTTEFDQLEIFRLERDEDVSGTSGVGVVAKGVKFPSGTCVLEWTSYHHSIGIFSNIDQIMIVHGHGGKTRLVIEPKTEIKKKRERKSKKV